MSEGLAPQPMTIDVALDRIALQNLAWTYCHAIDRQDFRLLRSLYHDDAIDDHGAMFCGGPDALVAWLPSILAHWRATIHTIAGMVFVIDGDEAEGELVSIAYHRTADGTREIIAHGRYLDRYRKSGGVWRFQHRSLVLDAFEDRAVPPATGAGIDDGIAPGRPGADDPLYARLPRFARDRAGR